MKTIVPGNVASACSSTSRDARSRWLVGSSMHRSAAGRTSIFASATRAFSPPESTARVALAKMLVRSEEHTSELQSHSELVCRLLLEKKKNTRTSKKQIEMHQT